MPTLRKILIVTVTILIFQFLIFTFAIQNFSFQFSIAQSPLEKAQEDYTHQFTEFRKIQEKYTTARYSYLTFKTAAAKNEAFLKTKEYLNQVDNLYLAYLSIIKEIGNSLNPSKVSGEKEEIIKSLDSEYEYLKNHQQKLNQAQILEELPPQAEELKNYLETNTLPKVNKAFAIYDISETEASSDEFNNLSGVLGKFANTKISTDKNPTFFANWESEIENIRQNIELQNKETQKELEKTQGDTITSGQLEQITQFTTKSKNQLLRSKPLFEEILRII